MRALQALMMLFGALAVLMTGVLPAAAAGATTLPACHDTATHHGDQPAPSSSPDKPMKAMNCCVACVTTPALQPPERARLVTPRPAVGVRLAALPSGRRPSPEPHPPRMPAL